MADTEKEKQTGYVSPWQDQLKDTMGKILNREKFSYDLNGDALWQQYKDAYTTKGKMAMMDTMGQAQTMTGGYGNSYAQGVGQQAYQGHIQGLTDKIPELYQLAMAQYGQEGQDLLSRYSVLSSQDQMDYGKHRDTVADSQWQAEFNEALRQFNFQNKLGEFAPTYTPVAGQGKGTSQNPDPGIDVEAEYRYLKESGEKGTVLDSYLKQMISEGHITKDAASELRNKRW